MKLIKVQGLQFTEQLVRNTLEAAGRCSSSCWPAGVATRAAAEVTSSAVFTHTHSRLSDRLCSSCWVRAQWFTTDVQIERHVGDLSQFPVKNLMFNVSEASRLAASMLTHTHTHMHVKSSREVIVRGVWTHFQLYSGFYHLQYNFNETCESCSVSLHVYVI